MTDQDRRTHPREETKSPVGLMMAAGSLEGDTINISQTGALIRATGAITILLKYEGKEYRGRLVRATPIDGNTTAYAVQLDDPVGGE